MKYGYARVSTNQQDTKLQIDALQASGCSKIYEDKMSGSKVDRPELNQWYPSGGTRSSIIPK